MASGGGGERMGMERQLNHRLARAVRRRGRPGRFEWLWRSLLALLGVALFHGVFACMVLEKARRAVVPEVRDEETLRLWCMSADDGRLLPLASDFLRLNDALLDDVGQVTLLDASLEHPVRQASPSGLTLGWGDFTRRLDDGLSASPLSLGRHGESGMLPPSLASLRHDLSLWALDVRVSVVRQQLCDLSGAMGVVRGEASSSSRPLAMVSRYEDSAWSAVPASELGDFGKRAAILLASRSGEGSSEESAGLSAGAPCQVVLSVVERGRQGARVQVRVSSGNAELDGLARSWALRRHGWLGHHQPLPGEAERRREIEYVFEVRPGTAAERR